MLNILETIGYIMKHIGESVLLFVSKQQETKQAKQMDLLQKMNQQKQFEIEEALHGNSGF